MKRLIGWLVVLIVLAAGAGFWWVRSYRPLEAGPVFGTVGATFRHGTIQASERPIYARVLDYRHGEEVATYFSIRNAGPFAVTVEGIEDLPVPPEDFDGLLSFIEARMGRGNGEVDPGETVPLSPFSLGSGEERLVLLRWRFDNCRGWDPDDTLSGSRHEIGYRVMGLSRSATIELPGAWAVEGPPADECPGGG